MQHTLEKQKIQSRRQIYPSLSMRIDRLDRMLDMMLEYQTQIPEALSEDFGHRPEMLTKFAELAATFDSIHFIKKNLKSWMKPERRKATPPFNLFGAKAYIQYQPVGVVGIISPWNYPFNLTFGPLAVVLAAGNRAMIKPSEYTPRSSSLMKSMINKYFDADEVEVFPGDASVGQEFSSLHFDHLLFTGSTSVAKKVMEAASKNLVPVTLELGGKSPAIIGESADLKKASDRIWNGKLMNAGQTCIAPDYVYVKEDDLGDWMKATNNSISSMYPTIFDNDDYTSVVNEGHYARLDGYIEDAKNKGADVIEINPANESEKSHNKMMPTIVLNATDDMLVMQEEIFGPIMPVKTYNQIDEVVDYINLHERPLGLYYFGNKKSEEEFVMSNTVSGGAALNDVIFQFIQDDLPFGGIGPSGMGNYHGIEGFKTFSHARGVYKQTSFETVLKLMRPPFSKLVDIVVSTKIKK
ncbi:MAG TPA: coniferyl aldehyde dehydrogenase [Gammaproteobacteria bacterium]|nr:coniferyl aldehyde dehydrogenase [Gammaproteobacteria bacterium]